MSAASTRWCRWRKAPATSHDSGTRLLFDQLLALHGIDQMRINGTQQIEFTHAAVAAYVASGMADVSFGVEAAHGSSGSISSGS